MVRGRREEEDLGVETPVWGPVFVPYISTLVLPCSPVKRSCWRDSGLLASVYAADQTRRAGFGVGGSHWPWNILRGLSEEQETSVEVI